MYNGVSKGTKDPVIDQMVDEATEALEAIVDESWVPWASHQVREAEEKVCEEHDCKI